MDPSSSNLTAAVRAKHAEQHDEDDTVPPEEPLTTSAAEYDQWREKREREQRLSVLQRWGVPRRAMRHLHPSRLQETPPLGAVRAWASSQARDRWGLVLSSGPGSGKSVAAAWWLLQRSEGLQPGKKSERTVPRWVTGGYLVRASSYDGSMEELAKGALVIDDLGVEYADRGGHFQARLDELLDERYRQERQTLITTNLNGADFRARYGARVVDRLRDGGGFYEFDLPSMRGKA